MHSVFIFPDTEIEAVKSAVAADATAGLPIENDLSPPATEKGTSSAETQSTRVVLAEPDNILAPRSTETNLPTPELEREAPSTENPSVPLLGSVPNPSAKSRKASPADDERYLSVREVADRYSVSIQTVWRHTKLNPDFPKPTKVLSGSTRWKLRDLVAYEARRQEEAR
ncbi:hypothetical protein [Sinorhizobium sp. BG8]|uniref:helix-turn-helix transcriptional regulator n=1 Tax=Sinorhizobium sp. BG8 TaxID=2613773 RepID=UPI00193CF975|nr:hypothetical protein [Sinorhizobium sp. BG8]QRM53799.1 hypothetical protein F3Y30_03930 [Sinorhizobium sp. BG8]